MTDRIDRIARAICRETCAFMGEPPCFDLEEGDGSLVPWPNPDCDEPGCRELAVAVAGALDREQGDRK